MNKKLATYLFDEEVLYATSDPKTYVAIESEEKLESEPKVIEAKPFASIPKEQNQEEEISKDEIVFQMKTHHLFIFNSINSDEKDFLLKIVQALGLSFTKIDLLDISKNPLVDFKQTIYENTIRTIIFFGEKSGKDFLPKLGLTPYHPKNIKNINFLFVDQLAQVSENQNNEKRRLWEALKGIFQN